MTAKEFSNELDVLYNSITSNKAPGLDEYEKSVFLTKAQYETVLSYFDPRKNKVQEGYDGSQKRQIDFSQITKVHNVFRDVTVVIDLPDSDIPEAIGTKSFVSVKEVLALLDGSEYDEWTATYRVTSAETAGKLISGVRNSLLPYSYNKNSNSYSFDIFQPAVFDTRDNSISIDLPDVMLFINERTTVRRVCREVELVTIPIQFGEYDKLMSKPYKRPAKNQAWRIMNSTIRNKADIVVGPSDTILKYSVRYLKRPKPIITENLDGLTIEGHSDVTECELDPIIHQEILQRAVELAKASYLGNLQDMVSLRNASQTDIGMLIQSR